MEKPLEQHYIADKGLTTLFFADGAFSDYRMRGGVLFPQMYDDSGRMELRGHIVLSGQDVNTKKIYIFEDTRFYCVDPFLAEDGRIEISGVAEWLNMCWTKYYCNRFYWAQNSGIAGKFKLQIGRSPLVGRRPVFIEIDVFDTQTALGTIYQWVEQRRLFWPKESILREELLATSKDSVTLPPSVHALAVLLAGIERSPYKNRRKNGERIARRSSNCGIA